MFSDKITKAIAEAAKTVMDTTNETWPDAASTSIYADKPGKAPISDMEAGMDHQMTDEEMTDEAASLKVGSRVKVVSGSGLDSGKEGVIVDRSGVKTDGRGVPTNLGAGPYKPIDWSKEVLIKQDDGKMLSMFKNRVVPIEESAITDEEISEALKKSQPASEWINDFVNSKDAKFKGKSKGERINMALGAYYAAQRNESVSEGVEEPRAQGEKNFKAAHTIVKMADPNADRQTGTEAMDQKAKPVLPIGKTFSKADDIDGEKYIDKDVADIKSSGTRATAPKATGAAKLTYADGCDVYNKTAAAIKKSAQGAASAPKASGSKQSGAQSIEKVSNTAPNGKLSAEYPKAKQKGSEAMPKGLKETALATLLGEDTLEEGLFDNIKALGSNVAGAVKSKVAAVGQKIGDEIEKAKKQGNAAELARLQARANQLKLNLPAGHADAPATAAKPASGAAGMAQKAAQAKLTKMSTPQLQASLARIQSLLKQRGVTEEVSFDEAFEFLGESLINEAMTNFDKQFADDNEKALKQILNNQGTDGIECHGQPKQRVLLQLNKFIDSYGDELKKYFGIPVQDKEVNEAAEMSDEDRDNKVSAIFKRFGIQDTNYEQDLDKAIEDLSKKSRIAAAQVKSLLKDSVNEAPYTPEYLGTGEETALNRTGATRASDWADACEDAAKRVAGLVNRQKDTHLQYRLTSKLKAAYSMLADVAEKLDNKS